MIETMRDLQTLKRGSEPQIAILIDPEKTDGLAERIKRAERIMNFGYILLGGSTGYGTLQFTRTFSQLRTLTERPIIYFPGSQTIYTLRPDAFLFLIVLNSQNPRFLIGQSRSALKKLELFGLQVRCIPVGYLICEPGGTVGQISEAELIQTDDYRNLMSYVRYCEIVGIPYLYLEAGSGAAESIPAETVRYLRARTDLYLIIGGGIRSISQIRALQKAGADLIVVGNAFETDQFIDDSDG